LAVTDQREIALWRSRHPDSRMLYDLAMIGESCLLEGDKAAVAAAGFEVVSA
jgi:hypothetical protein